MTEGSEGWTDPGEADTPVVEFDHVNLRYAGAGEDSLTDISFRAMPGQTIGCHWWHRFRQNPLW